MVKSIADSCWVVPWYNIDEWKRVKDFLQSENLEKWKKACQKLEMWKLRYPKLPVNIECTLGVLQAIVQDYNLTLKDDKSKPSDSVVMSYCTSLMRFVNHVSAGGGTKRDTLYLAALKSNIPDWLVNLRHDIAHGSFLPPLDILRSGANFSMRWLLINYWKTQDGNMSVFNGSGLEINDTTAELTKLQTILQCGITAWRQCCIAIREGRRFVIFMNDDEWHAVTIFRKRLKGNAALVKGGKGILEELQKVIRKGDLLRSVTVPDKKKKRGATTYKVAVLALNIIKLLSSGPALGKNLVQSLLQTDFLLNEGSDWRRWKLVIGLLDDADALSYLIQRLLAMLASDNGDEAAQSAGWLTVLAPSLEVLHRQYDKESVITDLANSDTSPEATVDQFPEGCIVLKIRRPPSINLEMLKLPLLNPTEVSKPVIEKYLSLLYPPLPTTFRSKINDLLNIFTEKELVADVDYPVGVELLDVAHLKFNSVPSQATVEASVGTISEKGNWNKIAYDTEVLKRHPLGILPGQLMPELDLSDMVFEFYPAKK